MKNKNKITSGLLLLAVTIAIAASLWHFTKSKNQEPFVVAINMALTGPIANSGQLLRASAEMAIDELGPSGSLTGVNFTWSDNKGLPAEEVTLALRSELSDPAIHFIGYDTRAALSALGDDPTPVFSFSFMPSITSNPKVFRNCVSYKLEHPVFVDFIKKQSPKKVAAVFLDIPEAQEEFQKFIVPDLKSLGWQDSDLLLIPYSVVGADYRTISEKLKAFQPDTIVLSGFDSHLAPLIEALRSSAQIEPGKVIATFDLANVAKVLDPALLEGITFTIPDCLLNPGPKTQAFIESFKTRFGRSPTYSDLAGYDFVVVVNAIAQQTRLDSDPSRIISALAEMSVEGASGPITFDSEGDARIPISIGIYQNGKVVPYTVENK
jgi:branched-chain amino acid transport system substrate-binding protein